MKMKKKLAASYYRMVARNSLRFAVELNRRMKGRGIKLKQLANKVGLSPACISRVLRGDENLTLEMMAKLADAVGAEMEIQLRDEANGAAGGGE